MSKFHSHERSQIHFENKFEMHTNSNKGVALMLLKTHFEPIEERGY